MLRSPTLPAISAGLMTLLALGIGAAAEHHKGAKLFSIPPGPAETTLNEWSRQSGIQVLFDCPLVQNYRTRAVAEAFTPLDALGAMLRDTPLTFSVVNDRTIAVIVGTQYCEPWLADAAPLPPCVQMPGVAALQFSSAHNDVVHTHGSKKGDL